MDKPKIKKDYLNKIQKLLDLNKHYYDLSKPLVDDKEYDIANLSDRARKLTDAVQDVSARIQESNNMLAILTKAKRAYIEGLKSEMLSAKAGFDFGSD